MALNSDSFYRREILLFYKAHPEAYGQETILELWKAYADDAPISNTTSSAFQIKQLKEIIVRQTQIEQILKDREEREADKQAKLKATKGKKSTDAAAIVSKKGKS